MLLSVYKTLTGFSGGFLTRHLHKRSLAGKEDPLRLAERQGIPSLQRPEGHVIWMHAASVGESLSLLPIMENILQDFPFTKILVTTGTVTSARLMAQRLPSGAFHQYIPLDHPRWVESFIRHWQPNFVVWAESDLWPNMLTAIRRRSIPTVLLNGRMSEKTFRHWRFARGFIRKLLDTFDLCLAQNESEAQRLRACGAPSVKIAGNLKYAAEPLPFVEETLNALRAAIGARPALLWASTHPGEEQIAVKLHLDVQKTYPDFLSVVIPRHPARGGDILDMARSLGVSAALRTQKPMPDSSTGFYIADTLGEMGLFFRALPVMVMGGSFANIGGHNIIEPGQLGCVIFYGPQMYNFVTISEDFESCGGACRVKDTAELFEKVMDFLSFPEKYKPMADAALKLTQDKAHVLQEIMADITPYLMATIEPGGGESST